MALEFDGNDQKVTNPTLLNVVPAAISISCWIKTGTENAGILIHKDNITDEDRFYLQVTGGIINFRTEENNNGFKHLFGEIAIDGDKWHNIMVIWDGGSGKRIFVDSVLDVIDGVETTLMRNGTASDFNIACSPVLGNYYDGLFSDVRVYNRNISLAEIKSIYYAQGADNIINGLLGRWLMNEKPDGTAAAGANVVIDISGNGNHGTPVNAPVYRAGTVRLIRPTLKSPLLNWTVPKALADPLAFTDTIVKKPSRLLADTLAFTDAIAKFTSKIPFTDNLAFTDVLSHVVIWGKALADSIGLTDSFIAKCKKVFADDLTFTDAIAKFTTKIPFTDSLALTDAIAKETKRLLTDGLALTDSLLGKIYKTRDIVYDIVSRSWLSAHSIKVILNLLRKFVYDATHETSKIQALGSISRMASKIVSGGTQVTLVNTAQYWNKFLSDKTNIRQTATLQLGVGVENTIARAGVARAGITVANLTTLKTGSVVSSGIFVPGAGQWFDVLTGWGDDPLFQGSYTTLAIRDKFAGLFEKTIGSQAAPVDFYSIAHNPADLAWHILVDYGGLDSTVSTANTDIDYTTWLSWWTDCDTVSLSLEARFNGQTVKQALQLVRDLSNSGIFVAGDGKLNFFRFKQAAAPSSPQHYTTRTMKDFSIRLDDSQILNYLRTFYDLEIADTIVTNGDMEAADSWTTAGANTNERSNDRAYRGTYSRKIITDKCFEGVYQNLTTVVGKRYSATARVYVTAGEAIIGIGPRSICGLAGGTVGAGGTLAANTVMFQPFQSGFSGDVDRIVAKIDPGVSPPYTVKLALYERTDSGEGDFLKATEEKEISVDEWASFEFTSPVTLVSGSWYQLAIWTPDFGVSMDIWSGGANRWHHTKDYNSWPSAVVGALAAPHGSRFWFAGQEAIALSAPADAAEWVELSFNFTATSTTSRLFLESNNADVSTFYVDEVVVREILDEEFAGSYLKEDPTSQGHYGTSDHVTDGTVVWHANSPSAIAYTDRRIEIHKDPLAVIAFTSFLMGFNNALGDIIQVTHSFHALDADYFRIYKILDINLAAATITFEAADFADITP